MEKLTIDWIKENGLLMFEAITGSRAYNLDTPTSDTDIRGVFILPKEMFYGLQYTNQVNNETNDIVYYELRRFMELLAKNNPNILEMLSIPQQFVLQRDIIMNKLQPDNFLSKLCEKTFANYAFNQIKKAYGLEKKILNPIDEERKAVLDFCFVYLEREAIPLRAYLKGKGLRQEQIGLTSIAHLKDCYNLYVSDQFRYAGVIKNEKSNDVNVSSIPKGEMPSGMRYFNKDGYSGYCKRYNEYWEWVAKRNDERYKTTMSHGKNYDSKNLMHVFRLLLMAKEIAIEKKINVYRKDREFLLDIKRGKFNYDELVSKAEALKNELPFFYQNAELPDAPDMAKIDRLLVEIREEYYNAGKTQ